jgi:two-component system CheB/CheR fusion protein
LVIDADPTRLEQIIWNLVNNALKFTPSDGRVELIAQRVENMAQLDVVDSGVGLEQHNLHKIFDLFSQADSQHTAHHREGLGIGLSLVRQLVEAHGGSVNVHSEGTGRGCTFTIRLPLCPPQQHAHDQPHASSESGRLIGQKIMLVDDSRDVMEVLQMLLEMEDAHVEAFSDPLLALQAAKESNYDVIISDIGMPVMNGHELMHAIRQIAHLKHTPAIALTGYGTVNDQKKAKQSGFNYHVSKPVSHDDFIDIIDEACTARPY